MRLARPHKCTGLYGHTCASHTVHIGPTVQCGVPVVLGMFIVLQARNVCQLGFRFCDRLSQRRPDRLHGLLALSSEIPKTQTSVLEVGTCQHPQIPQALPPVQGAAAIQITGRPLRNMRNGSWSVSMDLLIFLSVLLSVSLSLPPCLPVYTADTRCISFLMRVCSVAGWMDGWMDAHASFDSEKLKSYGHENPQTASLSSTFSH